MNELETRELEYFLAVADELHFGRAAVRLSIAQPALSKAVRRIEHRLGVTLFVRSSRHVELTPAGEALREHGRHALNAVAAAVRHAQNAEGGRNRLRLVLKPGGDGGLLSGILAAYGDVPEARQVDILFSGPADRADFLLDGRADVGLLYAPFDPLDGLAHARLYTEDRVAVLPSGHRLARRASLRLADLDGQPRPDSVPALGNRPLRSLTSSSSCTSSPRVSWWRCCRAPSSRPSRSAWSSSRSPTPRRAIWCSPGTSRIAGRWSPRSSGL
jgi:DNA-binding transcriptional LysR family regulator